MIKGFTLVEVLISLFILSLVAVTGITSLSYSTKTVSSLSDDFYRTTLAENVIIRSYFDESYLTNNLLSQREDFMGYPYVWNRKISVDPNQRSLNIEVEVISQATEKSTKLEVLKQSMNNLKGYTLVEVLIVMTLFSVISLLSLSFLNTSVSSSIGISSKSKLLNELSLLSELLKDDLFHVAKQYPRADELNQFPTFFKLDNDFREGEPILELVRNSASDGIEDQGAINKIHYKVKDNVLYRNYSSYLNSAYQERPFALVSEIEDIEIKALYDKNEYLIWPPFNEADIEIYPTLLEVNIIFNEGNFKKIFFISGDDVVG